MIAVFVGILGLPQAGDASSLNQPTDITFGPALPCAVVCPYYLDTLNTDLDDDGVPDVYFQACDAPFPPYTYHDITVWAPPGALLLEVWIEPMLDWDLFICSLSGDQLTLGGFVDYRCNEELFPVPVGCREGLRLRVTPTHGYVLRAYNWSDVLRAPGWYAFWDSP